MLSISISGSETSCSCLGFRDRGSAGGGVMGALAARLKLRRKAMASDDALIERDEEKEVEQKKKAETGGGAVFDGIASMIPEGPKKGGDDGGEDWDVVVDDSDSD